MAPGRYECNISYVISNRSQWSIFNLLLAKLPSDKCHSISLVKSEPCSSNGLVPSNTKSSSEPNLYPVLHHIASPKASELKHKIYPIPRTHGRTIAYLLWKWLEKKLRNIDDQTYGIIQNRNFVLSGVLLALCIDRFTHNFQGYFTRNEVIVISHISYFVVFCVVIKRPISCVPFTVHWNWDNLAIAPMPVKYPWVVCVNMYIYIYIYI